ncbi:MAG: DUF5652 family protein [bacterium]
MMNSNLYYPQRFDTGFGHGFGFGPGWFLATALFGGLFIVIVLISLALKGWALWTAAKRREKFWFIALLFINTLGILELVYLIFFAKVLFNKNCCKHEGCTCGDCDKCKQTEDKKAE